MDYSLLAQLLSQYQEQHQNQLQQQQQAQHHSQTQPTPQFLKPQQLITQRQAPTAHIPSQPPLTRGGSGSTVVSGRQQDLSATTNRPASNAKMSILGNSSGSTNVSTNHNIHGPALKVW